MRNQLVAAQLVYYEYSVVVVAVLQYKAYVSVHVTFRRVEFLRDIRIYLSAEAYFGVRRQSVAVFYCFGQVVCSPKV